MWEAKQVLLWCACPVKILLDSAKIVLSNKVVFCSIIAFTTLPLSSLTFSLSLTTHTLRTQIYHLEAVALLTPTRYEARHVSKESREDAVSLLRIRALFSLPCYLLSLAAAVSAVHSTLLASHGKTPTLNSSAAALRYSWKRPSVTSILIYAILLAFAPVPRLFAAPITPPGSRFLVLAIGSGVEVYLMAVLSLGLVVSVAEERFGWEAIRVGSGLMQGRRFCGWVLSGLLVLLSGLINSKLELLLDGQDSVPEFLPSTAAKTTAIGVEEKAVLICSYGLVVLWSYVITTVFYCDCRRRHPIREPDPLDDDEEAVSVRSSL